MLKMISKLPRQHLKQARLLQPSKKYIFNMFKKEDEPKSVEKQPVETQDNYEFIKMDEDQVVPGKAEEKQPKEQMSVEEYKQMAEIKEEETQVLWDYYAIKEEEGLERFESSIATHEEFTKDIVQSKDISDLSNLIGETNKKLQLSFKREHKYNLKIYEEQLYKEVMYDARPSYEQEETMKFGNKLKKVKAQTEIRNLTQHHEEAKGVVFWPIHKKIPRRVTNMHEGGQDQKGTKVIDPYHWVENMTASQESLFRFQEGTYTDVQLTKYHLLEKQIGREYEFYKQLPVSPPMKIGEHVYYRRLTNPADAMTLYRFPEDEMERFGFTLGDTPYMMEPDSEDEDSIAKHKVLEKEFPEEVIFQLSDFVDFYRNYALEDERIKEFVEKIKQFVEQMSHQPLHYFQISEQDNYCVMIFDTEQNGKSFDIVVKDLNSGQLLPVLILNALDEVAFDQNHGFYYTQVDADGRGKRVYRHQIGTLQTQDVLIYEETNADFQVTAENTGSKEFVSINIVSTFEPKTNEIWLRNSKEEKEKFWLVQPMQMGVNYKIQHSGQFLYKMSNENDLRNYAISKIQLPNQLKYLDEGSQQHIEAPAPAVDLPAVLTSQPEFRLAKREIAPNTKYLIQRNEAILPALLSLDSQNASLGLQLPKNVTDVIEADFNVKIIQFEVFKNYMAVVQERAGIRELKIVNLVNESIHIHSFDQADEEMSQSDGKRCQFYDINLQNNLSYEDVNVSYMMNTPNAPPKKFNFNMGTKRANLVSQESYANINGNNLKEFHCEKIAIKMRDNFEIPMVIKYDKRFYNEDSPWVMFTQGAQSNKSHTSWNRNDIALMSRGIVCAYPLLRGTDYFDQDWMTSAIAERKLTHIMDCIDSAIFLKDKGLTSKLAIHGKGESGSLTALASIFQEPYLFETAVVVNPITDLVHHLLYDIENREALNQSQHDHDLQHFQKLQEFGDPQNRLFYEAQKLISPYQMPVADQTMMHTDLLMCVDQDYPYKYHARKLTCKLRQLYEKDNSWFFYNEYDKKAHSEDEKYANQLSFIVNSLMFN